MRKQYVFESMQANVIISKYIGTENKLGLGAEVHRFENYTKIFSLNSLVGTNYLLIIMAILSTVFLFLLYHSNEK